MDIVVIKKDSEEDIYACSAISLLMAVRSLGRGNVSKKDIYEKARCVGSGNLSLPWGICKAAHEFGFSITYGSKDPYRLVVYRELIDKGGLDEPGAENLVATLISYCKDHHDTISLVKYPEMEEKSFKLLMEGYLQFMEYIVQKELGVVIVALKWTDTENHALLIKEFTHDKVVLVDCTEDTPDEQTLIRNDFKERWNHQATDNDFFILWNTSQMMDQEEPGSSVLG